MARRMDARGGSIAAVGALVGLGCCVTAERWRCSHGRGGQQAAVPSAGERVLLFYKYVAISDVDGTVAWMQELSSRLGLLGRVLLAEEGVNGSVSGPATAVRGYIAAMAAHPLFGGIDWKDSSVEDGELMVEHGQAFGDLVVKRVKELVSTAGAVSLTDVATHGGKHLSPAEFHARVVEAQCSDDTVLLDVRNTFESDIGRFKGATPVPMASFSEYTSYAESKLSELRGKKVLMYCTGGIRCEKASAYLRKRGVQDVSQLSGGIHRYLEAYPEGSDSAYVGKNFVFDRRMSQSAPSAQVVGRCVGCDGAYDVYEPRKICCVCRQLVLLCAACDAANTSRQYHCPAHRSLAGCFFRFLEPFTVDELQRHEKALGKLLDAADTKSKRKTLRKQLERVHARLSKLRAGEITPVHAQEWAKCATCAYCERSGCDGKCWGVWATSSGTSSVRDQSGCWQPRKHLLDNTGGPKLQSWSADSNMPTLIVGQTVVRGPDWRWGRQDGGEGQAGVVETVGVEVAGENNASTIIGDAVRVRWRQTNLVNVYRYGANGCYDVVAS